MKADELRALQAPLKERYKSEPAAALITLRASGRLGEGITCGVQTSKALVEAGLHRRPAAAASRHARATCCSKRSSPAPA